MSAAIERQIRDLKATDELRRELIANVSHDLRTPLAALRGYIETLLIKADALATGDLRAHLSVALRQTDQLGRLIDAPAVTPRGQTIHASARRRAPLKFLLTARGKSWP